LHWLPPQLLLLPLPLQPPQPFELELDDDPLLQPPQLLELDDDPLLQLPQLFELEDDPPPQPPQPLELELELPLLHPPVLPLPPLDEQSAPLQPLPFPLEHVLSHDSELLQLRPLQLQLGENWQLSLFDDPHEVAVERGGVVAMPPSSPGNVVAGVP
jgi:hypothetical protein